MALLLLRGRCVHGRSSDLNSPPRSSSLSGNQRKIASLGTAAVSTTLVHELLQRQPMLSVKRAAALLENKATFTTVNSAFARLAELEIVEEKTGGARNRIFAYNEYLRILSEGTEPL